MKQYKSLSLALLLSAPAFAMEVPKPTSIHDSSGSPEVSEAFIGFHTYKDEEAAASAVSSAVVTPLAKNKVEKDEQSGSIVVSTITQLSRLAADEAAAARAMTQAKDMEDRAIALQQAAEARVGDIYKKHAEESRAITERFTEPQLELTGYESDTEKGLSQENIQLYRFSKYVASTKKILLAAHPLLIAWLNDTENDKLSEKLPEYATQLDTHTNRIEVWQTQIGLTTCKKLTGYDTLKNLLAEMKKGFGKFATDKNSEKADKFEHNISHPAIQFLMVAERLEKLLE